VFQTNQYPTQSKRQELAQKLCMSQRKVQVWFQNRRIKAKTVPDEDTHQLQLLSQGITFLRPKAVNHLPAVDSKEVNLKQEGTGNSLLLIAIAMDHPAIHSLLAKGADCNLANKKGIFSRNENKYFEVGHLSTLRLSTTTNI
jgi:hypothetical protein